MDDATFDEAVDVVDAKAEKKRAFEPEHKALTTADLEKMQQDVAERTSSIMSIQVSQRFWIKESRR